MKANNILKWVGAVALITAMTLTTVQPALAATDVTPPTLVNVVMTGQRLDGNDIKYGVAVAASDNMTGIEHIDLTFENTTTGKKYFAILRARNLVNGIYMSEFKVNAFDPDGTIRLKKAKLVDFAGNVGDYCLAEDRQDDDFLLPCAVSFQKQVNVAVKDVTGPVFAGIVVSPQAGDDDTEFTVAVAAADDYSGVDSVKVRFVNQYGNGITVNPEWNGVNFTDVVKKTMTKAGSTYRLSSIVLKDRAGNRTEYSTDLGNMFLNTGFTVQ